MKIGIYNRFLATLGGGERYMLKIAQLLTRVGDVDILSQTPVPAEVIQERLGIDVSNAGVVKLEDPSIQTAERASEKYDLFINASHLDPVASHAARSILLVYFPSATSTRLADRLRQTIGDRVVREIFSVPLLEEGFGPAETSNGRRFWWTDGEGHVRIRCRAVAAPELIVPLASFRHDGTGPLVRFLSGDQEVGVAEVPAGSDFHAFRVTPWGKKDGEYRLVIHSDTFVPPAEFNDSRHLGVAVGEIALAGSRGRMYRLLFHRLFPSLGEQVYGQPASRTPPYVTSYDVVWTISRFVQEWTRRYWGIGSSLINPPVDVEGIQAFGLVPKQNRIISVGRFFESNHNKKHLEMISAFRRMLREGLTGWELVLVGGISNEPIHQDYLKRVRDAAEGLPVRIALDISYDELVALYASSSIYWHATGYGEDERRDPAAMEHFGITTVEAMAAGCVPIVVRKAGQRETVRHRQDGFLWRDIDDLTRYTWNVIRNPVLRSRLAQSARERSKSFSGQSFECRLTQLIDEALARSP